MQFINKECAERWLNSDRKFRDKEWPLPSSSLEIIIAPLKYKPPKSKHYHIFCYNFEIHFHVVVRG